MNTPNNPNINPDINPDDPKWTAYVLGECDEAERAEIELLLKTSEEARTLVEELTVATASMKEELAALAPLMMTPEQRAAIRDAARPAARRWFEVFPLKWGLGLAAAAVLVAVTVPVALRGPQKGDQAVEGSRPAGQVMKLPEVTIVRNEPQTVEPKASDSPSKLKESESREGTATAAPVLSAEEFAALAQGGPPVPNPASVTPPVNAGSLIGIVQDPTHAFIPGVTITATNSGTGAVVSTITNESGAYSLPNVSPGTYQVSATLPGFQTQTVTNLPVGARDQARVNYTLQVAALASRVEVSVSAGQLLSQSSTTVGEVVPEQRASNVPAPGDNALDLIAVLSKDEKAAASSSSAVRDGLSVADTRNQSANKAAAPPPPPPPAPPPPPTVLRQAQGQQGQGQGQGAARGGGGRGGAGGGAPAGGVAGGLLGGVLTESARLPAAAPPPPPPAAAPARADRVTAPGPNTEAYDRIVDNPFIRTTEQNLATFSIDVDTASYSNVRRFLNQNQIPPRDVVRIEEMLNYFNYDYAQPTGNAPIAPNMEVAATPWHPTNRLVRIGIKAREVNANRRPPSNLVFLIDVSGSMNSPERLPLVKAGLNMLVEQLGENDSVSIVVYAGNSGLVLAPTSGVRKEAIRQAIDSLQPGGSTNGASGIQLAYNQAVANFLRGGVNRVILMTDGDFNVGVTNQGELTRLIEERARSGVFLTVLGFGMGNIKDSTLEKLADQGNGNYAYIDNIAEARKVLVEEMSGTLVTVAKDVKIQVDFNPAKVEAYRLIGYENRVLRTEDFNNDAKDAGDMGAGHTVTALFEVVPKGGAVPGPSVDPSKYLQPPASTLEAARANAGAPNASSNELLTLRVRYKQPDSDTSARMDVPLVDRSTTFARATPDFRFAAGVAEFGMILRDSPYRGSSRMDSVLDIVGASQGADRNGYRKEFISLVEKARNLGR